MTFQNFGLIPELLRAINDLGHDTPTPIQDKAIPVLLKGSDVIALAQTGTGKTAGFALPMLQLLHEKRDPSTTRQPRGLILAPTRELAVQISESIKSYGKYLPLRSGVVYGGVNIDTQIRKLQRGDDNRSIPDLIVATPGRLLDLVDRRVINLSKIEILALDEADRMLDMGFINDIKKILALLPKQRQNMLFSATLSPEIQTLANSILRNHKLLEVTNRNITTDLVNQVVYKVDQNRKRELLSYLIGFNNWLQVLVFTRTKHNASKLCEQLIKDGLPSAVIHGDKSQGARTRALQEFKTGKVRVLVATDIAARGIDIEHLPYVVNFELPSVAADYVHRIGRTGRAGRTGNAISLVCASELQLLSDIEKLTKKSIAKKVLPGYEPTNNIHTEQMNHRTNRTRNITARQSTNQRFGQSEDRNSKYDARSSSSTSTSTRDKFSKPFASKPTTRSSEGNRRGDWQASSKPPIRSAEGNKRSNWQASSKPPVRSAEGNRRGNWQPGNKPSAQPFKGSYR